ncbi:MAG: sugar phosphate isomerase/epimerase [Pirellulales bacterium]|nr:sugar phosphate isomerase/epimerase [Pirellulales bacterium]
MRFGLNLLLWTDTLSDEFLPILDDLKEIGYDAVELPVFGPDAAACAKWSKYLDGLGLARTGTVVRGPDDNPISSDEKIRRAGIDANKKSLDECAALGCEVMAGPLHSALGCFSGKGPTADEWRWGVESMREVAEHAAEVNVTLGIEYLNRFECYFLNTAADGARFVRDVDHPRCQMMFDTFHSHIEEKSIPDAIRALKDCLCHVHISENDRSTPGAGNVRWDQVYDTLSEIGYDGTMVVEAFGLALPNLVAATKIWRRMYKDEKQLAADALSFMKSEVAKRN